MSQSLFTFFRGSAIIQARDLIDSPRSGITVQLSGDCHMLNFGGWATPERSLAFDIRDFDEAFPGPWEWDLKRLAASCILAARDRSYSEATAEKAAAAAVGSYRQHMSELAEHTVLERWYEQIGVADLLALFGEHRTTQKALRTVETRAARRTSKSLFPKLTTVVDGHAKIIDDPPRILHFHKSLPDAEKRAEDVFERYKASVRPDIRHLLDRYRLEDTAVKVVGVGSVGTHCYIALFLDDEGEPLFLQMKQASRSVLESPQGESRFSHQGERVVTGQRLMQAASDIFLGWTKVPGQNDYYVRQLRDMKVTLDIASLSPRALVNFAAMCGWGLARSHAKVGDAGMIAGYLGQEPVFDDAAVKYAKAYADQVAEDFAAFQDAIRSGRLPIQVET